MWESSFLEEKFQKNKLMDSVVGFEIAETAVSFICWMWRSLMKGYYRAVTRTSFQSKFCHYKSWVIPKTAVDPYHCYTSVSQIRTGTNKYIQKCIIKPVISHHWWILVKDFFKDAFLTLAFDVSKQWIIPFFLSNIWDTSCFICYLLNTLQEILMNLGC